MNWDLENTAGKADARKALDESKSNARRSNRIIDAATAQMTRIRAERTENHFTERFREIIRGES